MRPPRRNPLATLPPALGEGDSYHNIFVYFTWKDRKNAAYVRDALVERDESHAISFHLLFRYLRYVSALLKISTRLKIAFANLAARRSPALVDGVRRASAVHTRPRAESSPSFPRFIIQPQSDAVLL